MNNRKVIESMTEYLQTYPKQAFWEKYTPKTIIDDLVYGLGIAVDEKYVGASGYRDWKAYLIKFLQDTEK